MQAVCETWRNLISVGAQPIAITNCLNFGNPEKKEIMGQFVDSINGMKEACEALNYPVNDKYLAETLQIKKDSPRSRNSIPINRKMEYLHQIIRIIVFIVVHCLPLDLWRPWILSLHRAKGNHPPRRF
jgi:hypothetical protein